MTKKIQRSREENLGFETGGLRTLRLFAFTKELVFSAVSAFSAVKKW